MFMKEIILLAIAICIPVAIFSYQRIALSIRRKKVQSFISVYIIVIDRYLSKDKVTNEAVLFFYHRWRHWIVSGAYAEVGKEIQQRKTQQSTAWNCIEYALDYLGQTLNCHEMLNHIQTEITRTPWMIGSIQDVVSSLRNQTLSLKMKAILTKYRIQNWEVNEVYPR